MIRILKANTILDCQPLAFILKRLLCFDNTFLESVQTRRTLPRPPAGKARPGGSRPAAVAPPVDIRHICAMLDLPGHPELDKHALVGGCVRLPVAIDAARLAAEVDALPASVWGSRGGRVGVHQAAEAVFLRGHAPAEGDKPIEDRPVLAQLPYARRLIEGEIGLRPQRCLLARLPAGASVAPHVDRAPYFFKTLRVHVPVESHDRAWMICVGLGYLMMPGEAWVLNNSAVHGVWNAHPSLARTHMICDFLPDARLLDLLARGDRGLGRPLPQAEAHFAALARAQAARNG
jgi:hypothetical protein